MDSPPASGTRQGQRPRLMSETREDDLRARLAARDEGALSELVDLLSPWLLGITQSMLRDADEAEEVVMETFRIAWAKVSPPDAGARGLVPWVLHIARNRVIDRLRSRARRRSLGERWLGSQQATVAPVEPAEAALPGWHVHTAVHQALRELPEDQRQAGGAAGASTVSSYRGSASGFGVISASVPNGQAAVCWVAISPNGRFAYVTNTGSATLTGYALRHDGSISMLAPSGVTATSGTTPIDLSFSHNGRYVYVLNAGSHSIAAYRADEGHGALTLIGETGGLPVGANGLAAW